METAKIIIAGGREFLNYTLLKLKMDQVTSALRSLGTPIQVVSGCASGADSLGEKWARSRGFVVKEFPADWDSHGKLAGYLRNLEMAKYSTHLVAFWNGKSPGTKMMIDLARVHGLKVRVIKYA